MDKHEAPKVLSATPTSSFGKHFRSLFQVAVLLPWLNSQAHTLFDDEILVAQLAYRCCSLTTRTRPSAHGCRRAADTKYRDRLTQVTTYDISCLAGFCHPGCCQVLGLDHACLASGWHASPFTGHGDQDSGDRRIVAVAGLDGDQRALRMPSSSRSSTSTLSLSFGAFSTELVKMNDESHRR